MDAPAVHAGRVTKRVSFLHASSGRWSDSDAFWSPLEVSAGASQNNKSRGRRESNDCTPALHPSLAGDHLFISLPASGFSLSSSAPPDPHIITIPADPAESVPLS